MSEQKIGRYIVKGTLGRGGMGMVYLALDPDLDRLSAIKVMNTGGEVDDGLRTRFFREAKSVAKLRHPNIIAIYEMGEDGKGPFIVMEYVEGVDLKALIQKRVFIPFAKKMQMMIQICEALYYSHVQGVIHRDIKPANVRITREGEVRILDFGLARLGSSDITRTGMLMGTPYYMSPEQVKGSRNLDGRSDLFSTAVLLYELISYTRPFEADTSTGVCLKIVSDPHTPLNSVLPRADAELVAIIDRALAKSPEARYANCHELAQALKQYLLTVPQRMKALETEVASLEEEWQRSREESAHLVQLGILEGALLEPQVLPEPPPSDPEETVLDSFGAVESRADHGVLLLEQARLQAQLQELRQHLERAVPLQQLFKRGQEEFEQGNLESCLKTLAEILEAVPQNARALDMQRQCERLLEERRLEAARRARLEQALLLASDALQQGNLAQCIQAASRALQIEPGNSTAQELRQQASAALVRRRQVAELLAAARGYSKAQNHEACLQVCSEALALEPGNAELRLLLEQSKRALEQQRRIEELLKLAQEKLQAGDYHAALGATEQLLAQYPDLALALDLQHQAAEALERQLKVEELLAAARGYLMAGDFEASLQVCEQALQLSSDHPEIQDVQRRASEALQKQRRVAELLGKSRQELQGKNFQLAIDTAAEALDLDPGNRTAEELRRNAKTGCDRQQKVEQLLTLAQTQQAQRNFEGCLQITAEALTLDSEHAGHRVLQRWAQESLQEFQQIQQILAEARRSEEIEDFAKALDQVESALRLDPECQDALDLKHRASVKLERRNRFHACLEAARQSVREANYSAGVSSAREALELETGDNEARHLLELATAGVARVEKENKLLSQARRHFEKQQYEMAVEVADELLGLNARHAEAKELKREAIETQERRQRFEALLVAARNHAKAQDFAACLSAAAEALQIEPQHAELCKVHDRASQALEKERAISQGLARGRESLAKEDYNAALEALEEVLRLQPGHKEAQSLQRKATGELERQQRFEELLVAARERSKAQDHAACVKAAKEGLVIRPNHTELRKLYERSEQALERQRMLEAGLARARQELKNEQFEESLQSVEEVLKLEKQPEAVELQREASQGLQRQQRVQELIDETRQRLAQRNYAASVVTVQQALALKAGHPVLLELQKTAEAGLKRQQQLSQLIAQAKTQLEATDYSGALETCGECLELEADHVEAAQLHEIASEGLERRQRVEELMAAARGYFTAKDYDACLNSVGEALKLEPGNTASQSLERQAQQALEKERRIAGLLESAQKDFQEKRWQDALKHLDELFSLSPSHAAARQLKERVTRDWEKVQRLEQLLGEARRQASQADWEACWKSAEEGLKLVSNHTELQTLQEQARHELEKCQQVAELLKKARALMQKENFAAVLPLVGEALNLDSRQDEALQLQQQASAALKRQQEIHSLLETAQAHEAAQALEAALQVAAQGLELDPGNRQFQSIHTKAAKSLEYSHRVKALLASAQQKLQNQQHAAALEAAEELLKAEPSNAEGLSIKQAAGAALERLGGIERNLAAARSQASAGHYEQSLQSATQGLQLDPTHTELKQLAAEASQILEKRRKIEELLATGRAQFAQRNYEGAVRSAGQALDLASDHSEALQLKQEATTAYEAQTKKERIAALLAEARTGEKTGEFESCYRAASGGLNLEPENKELQALRDRSGQILETRRQVQILLERANRQWQAEDFRNVLDTADKALKLDPENAQATDFRQRAQQEIERRQRLKDLLAQARQADKARDYENCLQAAEEGLVLDHRHAELQQLKTRSRQTLDRLRRVAQLMESARQQLKSAAYSAALKDLEGALLLEPSHPEAVQLKKEALESLERQKQLETLLAKTRQHQQSSEWEACLEAAGKGLALESGHVAFQQIQAEARKQLELRRQIAEGLQQATQQLKDKNYSKAIEDFESVLKLDPRQQQALEGKRKAQDALERLKRLEEHLAKAKAAFDSNDYQTCHQAARQGLEIESQHPALQQLAQQSSEILERQKEIQRLWKDALNLQQAGDWPASLRSLDSLLELEPGNAQARDLRPRIVEALEKQRRIAGLLTEAAALEKAGDLEGCQRVVEKALAVDPAHSQTQQLQQRISLALERQRQIRTLLDEATQRLQQQDDAGALRAAGELLKLDPNHARGQEIRTLAGQRLEHEKRVEELLVRARKASDARDHQSSLEIAQDGLRLEPNHAEFLKLQARSREQLERQKKIRDLASEGQRKLGATAFDDTLIVANALETLDPGSTVAAELRRKAGEGLERHRRLQALQVRARELDAAGDVAGCFRVSQEGLELDPANAEFQSLRDRSSQELETRRREEEQRARVQQLLAAGKASFQQNQYRAAQRELTQLIELDTSHQEARGLLREAESHLALQRQKHLRLAKLASAALLAVSLLGSGLWYAARWMRERPVTSTKVEPDPVVVPFETQPVSTNMPPVSPTSPSPSPEEQKVSGLLNQSRDLLRDKKYSEANRIIRELLVLAPGHTEAEKIDQETRKNLDQIESGLKRARALLAERQYAEAAVALSQVIVVDPSQSEARRLMSTLDKYLRRSAEDARKQMQQTKARAGQAGASSLVQEGYQTASLLEVDATALFQNGKFGDASGKFYQASDAYQRAEGEARAKLLEQQQREAAAREKAAAVPPPLPPVDRQQEERDRLAALQKGQAQSAFSDYQKALSRASDAGAEQLAPEVFQQAGGLGKRAQEKLSRADYAGALLDSAEASRQLERAINSAKEVAQQRALEQEKRESEKQAATLRTVDVQAVQQLLKQYVQAMEGRNAEALRKTGLPEAIVSGYNDLFRAAKSVQVSLETLGEPRFASAESASVRCQLTLNSVMKDGQKIRNGWGGTFTFHKMRGVWTIESLRVER